MFHRLGIQIKLVVVLLAASLAVATAHGQTIGQAIAVDSSGSEYIGGMGATVSKTGGWKIRLGHSDSDAVQALIIAHDRSLLAAGSLASGGFIARIGVNGERTGWLNLDAPARALAVDAQGAVYAGGDGFFEKLNAHLEPMYMVRHETSVSAIAVRPDGTAFVAQNSSLVTYSPAGILVTRVDLGIGTSITGIARDPSAGIFVAGSTNSVDLPVARNRLNGPGDAFVARIGADGSSVEWSVYVGGSGIDAAAGIVLRPDGTLVVAGHTNSPDFPGASSSEPWNGGEDGFTAQLDAKGNILESGYFGSTGNDRLEAIAVDSRGKIHLAGKSEQSFRGAQVQARTQSLGLAINSLLEGPSAGSDSAIVLGSAILPWTAQVQQGVTWLHTSSSGFGNGVITFTFDANPGDVRSATISTSLGTLTVTQAGSGYQAAGSLTLASPGGTLLDLTLDAAGNIYIPQSEPAYSYQTAIIYEWSAENQQVTSAITGRDQLGAITVDAAGHIDFAELSVVFNLSGPPQFVSRVQQWTPPNGSVSKLFDNGGSVVASLKSDGGGNLYYSSFVNSGDITTGVVNQVAPDLSITTLYSDSTSSTTGVAVDALGNVFFATVSNANLSSTVRNTAGSVVVSSGLSNAGSLAVDAGDNLYIADQSSNSVKKWSASAGQLTTLLTGTAPSGMVVDSAGNMFFTAGGNLRELPRAYISKTTYNEGAAQGTGSLQVLPASQNLTGMYAPISDQSWLHIGTISNGQIPFSVDANLGAARTGHINVLGVSVTVSQDHAAVTLVPSSISILAGDNQHTAVGHSFGTNLKVIVYDQFNAPFAAANVLFTALAGTGIGYFPGSSLTYNNSSQADGTDTAQALTCNTLGSFTVTASVPGTSISRTFNNLSCVTSGINVIGGNNQRAVTGRPFPTQLQILVYDTNGNPSSGVPVTFNIIPGGLGASGTFPGNNPTQVSVNTNSSGIATAPVLTANNLAGNFLVQASGNAIGNAIFNVSNYAPMGIIAGNNQSVLINNTFGTNLQILVVDANANPLPGVQVTFTVTAGTGGATAAFAGASQFAINTDANGLATATPLTANGTAGSFTVVASAAGLTSQTFTLTNFAAGFALPVASALEGPSVGSDSIEVIANAPWTASVDPGFTWLRTTDSGNGNGIAGFGFDQNMGATRTGTLTIAGIKFTVTQAGSGYTQAGLTTLVSAGLSQPQSIAVDPAGTLYIADSGNNAIKTWTSGNGLNTLLNTIPNSTQPLPNPNSVAADAAGNVFIGIPGNTANLGSGYIFEYSTISHTQNRFVTNLATGLQSMAVNPAATVYFLGSVYGLQGAPASSAPFSVNLPSSSVPNAIAVDAVGTLYFTDSQNKRAGNQSQLLVTTGLSNPSGIAADAGGNLYIADSGPVSIKKWTVTSQQVSTLVSTGLTTPAGIAVDTAGDVFFADSGANTISELPRAFLSGTSFNEGGVAGSDTIQVLPATQLLTGVYAPTSSDTSWLTIKSASNGVITFGFTANTSGAARSANLTVLGVTIPVRQAAVAATTLSIKQGDVQSAVIGQQFATSLQVNVVDQYNQPFAGAPVMFTVVPGIGAAAGTFASAPAQPILTGADGVATAPLLTANATTGQFTVTARVTGISQPVTFRLTNTLSASANQLVFTTQPNSGTAGQALTPAPVVSIEDQYNNVVTTSTAAVTIGSITVNAVLGVATFGNLVFSTAGNYTLAATSPGLTSATSNQFTISAGTGSKLVFTTQPPAGGTAGVPFSATVKLEDANGNVVTSSTAQVTIGSTTVSAVAGVAAFTNLVFNTAGNYTLTATSQGLTNAISTQITISAAAPSQLKFTTQPPAMVIVGTAFGAVVQVLDAYGNVVNSNAPVTIGTSTVNAIAGVATFTNLVLKSVSPVTLTATSPGLVSATSASIIVIGVPDLIISLTHPGGAGGHFSQGQTDATYTITISNVGTGQTDGTGVTLTDTLPSGLTAAAMAGTGWTCTVATATCSRGDRLANGLAYPPIVVTVKVDPAAGPTLTNRATVSGGGDINSANNTATDPTIINAVQDVTVRVKVTQSGFAFNRGTGWWTSTMTIQNTGTQTISGPIQIVLTQLSPTVTMANNNGIRNGSPYITVLPAGQTLAAGASLSTIIQFSNPNSLLINFVPVTNVGVF